VVELVSLIREHADVGKAFDFAMFAGYFTLDSLTQIAFGNAMGFLTKNEDLYNYIQSSTDYYPIMELGSNHPFILNILNSRFMQANAAPKPDDKVGFGRIIGVAHKAVAERYGPDAKHVDDMIGSFVRHGLTQTECESETLLQILAGADSTATTLRTTVLYILTSPYVYANLLAEIKSAIDSGSVSYPVIKDSEAKSLPYLQACIKEGLRMYQPLCGLAGRLSPPGGATVNGVFIPGGIEVGIGNYAMMRRTDFFGPDADTFKPERWTENDPATVEKYLKTWELSFGTGRSSCLGKNIALMELGKAIFEVSIRNSITASDRRLTGATAV
jgi:cytochrome P450